MIQSVYGVGFLGEGKYNCFKNGNHTPEYKSWSRMMERCYSETYQKNKTTYVGCSVCDEWHNFQNFAEWHHANFPKYGGSYHLDKDIKIDGNKEYGPNTCMYVTPEENSIKAHARYANYITPNGELVEVYNITAFCRERGLCKDRMTKLAFKNRILQRMD